MNRLDMAPPAWHVMDRAQVERALQTTAHGLGDAEVAARLIRHGPNRLENVPPPSPLAILLNQFKVDPEVVGTV